MDEAQSPGGSQAKPVEKEGVGRVELPESDADLLAECEVETFRAGGPGGQHQNKTESAVRLRHRPSGIVVTCRQNRSQFQNKNICLKRLRAKVARLTETPPERRPTRPSRAARERRLEDKARQAGKKRERRPVQPGDGE